MLRTRAVDLQLGTKKLARYRGQLILIDSDNQYCDFNRWLDQVVTTGEVFPEWKQDFGPGELQLFERVEFEAIMEQFMMMYRILFPEVISDDK